MRHLLALFTGLSLSALVAAADQPNVMVFLVDDMGVMDTSVPFLVDDAGTPKPYPLNDFYRTPHVERLAQRGIRFSSFYAMSVCSPTRISILTGQNAVRHGATNWINPDRNNAGKHGAPAWRWTGLDTDDVTLPRLLRGQGYRTIHVGKAHFAPRDAEGADPSALGFDVNIGGASFGEPGSYYGTKRYGYGTRRAGTAVPHLEAYHGTETFLTEALTIEAKRAVSEAVGEDRPFFLYVSHYAVHTPFESDPRFAEHYANSGLSAAAQAYATLIEGADKSLGDMLDHLDALGVAEDTLVLFLGDNGTDAPLGGAHAVACAAPLRGKKGSHYEGGLRVPCIAAWARPESDNPFQARLPIHRGTVQYRVAAVYDLFPTILDLAQVQAPPDHVIDGVSLREPERNASFLMHYPHGPHRSSYFTTFRRGDWKVIYHYFPSRASGGGHFQLFDLSRDPSESTNLAGSQPEQLARMMKDLIAGLEEQGALYPVNEAGEPVKPKLP